MHQTELLPLASIALNPRNSRTHSRKQIGQISASIRTFGFVSALLVDENLVLIAGEGRWRAGKELGLNKVPVIIIEGLSEAEKRALMLADNRIPQNAGWDRERLAAELSELPDLLQLEGLDISATGFDAPEIESILADFENESSDPSDEINDALHGGPRVTRAGDIWQLGKHRLMCGDARDPALVSQLMAGERAQMVFLDPPYNVAVKSIVGRGRTKHEEFAMASGEMSPAEFRTFLRKGLEAVKKVSTKESVHYVCMDWGHIEDLLSVGRETYAALLNVAVWVKSNAGQGSFYRSQHEMIAIFRAGNSPHRNNIELGRHGRSRSNVWHYAGANSFGQDRAKNLKSHPTVKPVALVADAMKDCTRRDDLVLDTFCGSGTTILAAERVGRRACGMEIEPKFVDVAVRRWQAFTGKDAVHMTSRKTFGELAAERARG